VLLWNHGSNKKADVAMTKVGQPAGLWSTTGGGAAETAPLAKQYELAMHVMCCAPRLAGLA
jgi:hypothetical protein